MTNTSANIIKPSTAKRHKFGRELLKHKFIYLLLLPGVLYYIIFSYVPMYGITLAFREYSAARGAFGGAFIGLSKFRLLFSDEYFWYVFKNTLLISAGRILFQFAPPIIIAIMFNELRSAHLKKTLQTVYTFPHFLSWVIISGIVVNTFDGNGIINGMRAAFGADPVMFLGKKEYFVPLLYITEIWKESGWASIIYLAAISGINEELFEAADLDGANGWQKVLHITLPSIRPTIVIMLILSVGSILNVGFDQVFNLTNPVVQRTGDILDTYIYRITFEASSDFSFSTAVGLFKSMISFVLLILVNIYAKKTEGVGIFE